MNVNKLVRDETLHLCLCLYLQEKTPNSTSGFVVSDFIMPARDKPVSHSPSDPPLCENVSKQYFKLLRTFTSSAQCR